LSLDFGSAFFSSGAFGIMDSESTLLSWPGIADGCTTSSSNDCTGLIGEDWAACA
jgi:hypothetical protein